MLKRVLCIVIALVLVLAMMVGCGSQQQPEEKKAVPAAEEKKEPAAEQSGQAKEKAEASADYKDVKVVMIPKLLNSYFDAVSSGFEKAAKELGFEYQYTGPQTGEATSQIEFIEAAVQNGADVIMIAPNSNDALNPTFDDAREKGVKIVIVNQDLTGSETHRDAAILPTDFDMIAPYQLECLGSMINYEGEFAIMSATTDTPDQNYWIAGMKKLLESEAQFSKMKLVEVAYGDEIPEKTTTECEALITKYPNLRGIIAPTAVGLPICAKVVETKGLQDKICVTGLALPSDMRPYIKNKTVTKFQLWNPVDEGYLAGYYAAQLAKGQVDTKPGTKFTAGSLGEYIITEKGQILTGPPFTFDSSNIDNFSF